MITTSVSHLILLPLLIACLAIMQDLHLIADFNACVKDIIFVILMLQVATHAAFGKRAYRWLWIVFLVGLALATGLEAQISDWLPDTWILSQAKQMNGFPLMEILTTVYMTVILGAGLFFKHLHKRDVFAYALSGMCVIGSAHLWFAHLDAMMRAPEQAWTASEASEPVPIMRNASFVGQQWVIEHTNYRELTKRMEELITTQGTPVATWWGGLIGSEQPYLLRLTRTPAGVDLQYEEKTLEWGSETTWTWRGILSFILVFIEVFLMSQVAVRSALSSWT